MKYAVNKLTGKLESADRANHYGRYVCHECKTRVTLRAGTKRKPYFAHWRGLGSPECEKFVPGTNLSADWQSSNSNKLSVKETIEVNLKIPSRRLESWCLELTVPSCKPADGRVVIDVGGRLQSLDMRGMAVPRTVTAEPSHKPYRIVEYQGQPDPVFVSRVERECPGLKYTGATVFTALSNSEQRGFSVAKELRYNETFAFMWARPSKVSFPEALNVEFFSQRDGWSLALISLPDVMSSDVIDWLINFTGLKVCKPLMSIETLWPVINKRSNLDEVECLITDATLMFVKNVPRELQESELDVWVESGNRVAECYSVSGNEKLFSFVPQDLNLVSFTLNDEFSTYKVFSFLGETQRAEVFEQATVDLVFCNFENKRTIISLHKERCSEKVNELLELGFRFECLSIPQGVEGKLNLYKPSAKSIVLKASETKSPYVENSYIPDSEEALSLIIKGFKNVEYEFEINFGGFGSIYFDSRFGIDKKVNVKFLLPAPLRQNLQSFLSQLSISKVALSSNDRDLVNVFFSVKPSAALIPHYRALSSRIMACEGGNVIVKDLIPV
jgi:hypothetical protein